MRPTRRHVSLGFAAAALSPATALGQEQSGYEQDEVAREVEAFFGVGAEAAGAAVERIFREQGRPVGYIRGEEGSGAIGVGLRYGQGEMRLKSGESRPVFWRGPSIGWDFGGNAAKSFTLIYGLQRTDDIFQRFPGVEGSAYLIGGIGVNYQRADEITLAPMRFGAGLRLGANVGYLAYSRRRRFVPF